MIHKHMVREEHLVEFARCPMRLPDVSRYEADPVISCANKTCAWVLREASRGTAPSASQVRERYDYHWQASRTPADRMQPDYNDRVFRGLRICRRLRQLAVRFRVVRPMEEYRLRIGGTEVAGEYAVIRDRKDATPLMLRLRHDPHKFRTAAPDLADVARVVHASRSGEIHGIATVYGYWINMDFSAVRQLDPNACVRYLEDVIAAMNRPIVYPAPGDHCRTCPSTSCLPRLY